MLIPYDMEEECPECESKDILFFVKDERYFNWINPEQVWGICSSCLHEWDTKETYDSWKEKWKKKKENISKLI